MPWITITPSDVSTVLSSVELDAFNAAVLGDGNQNPLDEIITNVTNLVRGFCAASMDNRLEAGLKIPDILLRPALSLICLDVCSRCAGIILDPDGVRKENARQAMETLRSIQRNNIKIERPINISSEIIGYTSPVFHGKRSQFKNQFGI